MDLEQIISNGENIKEIVINDFLSSLTGAEKVIYSEIEKLLSSLSAKNGSLVYDTSAKKLLGKLQKIIGNSLKSSGYIKAAEKFVMDFDQINENIKLIHESANDITVDMKKLTDIQTAETQNTIDRLIGSGVDSNLTQPLKQSLYRHITTGGSIEDSKKILSKYIRGTEKENSKLTRYVDQVSRDSISQYEGAMQENIAKEYDLTDTMYVGSLIKDSRAQCKRWVKMKIIPANKLQSEIDWAFNNGSGMIADTTPETFRIYRGGYNCRHQAIPVFKK